ncbi:GNAT family N-acetyltransferase [Nocardioides campestrisoli]|uniref:GNAT family N-acetyltransferase n=1 Tax=Nocardioides campestrisoli TaxID=2736757 RepID=UPI001C62F9B9|nr:GNAT family N-acetyltransferase [Nocardioides campestrisoli]
MRPGSVEDLADVGELYLRSRHAAFPSVPAPVHSDAQVRAWVRGWDLTSHELWLAEEAGAPDGPAAARPLGFVLLTPTWVDHLYVDPDHQGHGIGSALVELVQALRPDGVGLWVFESNLAARRFYARHGFVEVERTDGSENEEHAPDIHLAWPA